MGGGARAVSAWPGPADPPLLASPSSEAQAPVPKWPRLEHRPGRPTSEPQVSVRQPRAGRGGAWTRRDIRQLPGPGTPPALRARSPVPLPPPGPGDGPWFYIPNPFPPSTVSPAAELMLTPPQAPRTASSPRAAPATREGPARRRPPVLALGRLELAVQGAGAAAGGLARAGRGRAAALVTVQAEAQRGTHRPLLQVHAQRAAVVGHTGHQQRTGGALGARDGPVSAPGGPRHLRAASRPAHAPCSHVRPAGLRGAGQPSPDPSCPSSARGAGPARSPAAAAPGENRELALLRRSPKPGT